MREAPTIDISVNSNWKEEGGIMFFKSDLLAYSVRFHLDGPHHIMHGKYGVRKIIQLRNFIDDILREIEDAD
jgi:hypothetical protein